MKFKIESGILIDGLKKIISVIPDKTTIPIIKNFLIETENDVLKITATDIDINISISLEIEKWQDGKITTPARQFFDIIDKIEPKEILEFVTGTKLTLRNKYYRYNFLLEDADDFPDMKIGEVKQTLEISSDLFKRLLSKNTFVSKDQLRPALTGIFFQPRAKGLRMVSTDSVNLAVISFMGKFLIDGKSDLLISGRSANIIDNILKSDDQIVDLKLTDNGKMLLEIDKLFVRFSLLNHEYPDYKSVIPKSFSFDLTVKVDNLLSSISRLMVFNNNTYNLIKFKIADNKLKLLMHNVDSGENGEERIDEFEYNGEDNFEIGINILNLMAIIRKIDSKKVIFSFIDALSIIRIFPENQHANEIFQMYVMPIRIIEED